MISQSNLINGAPAAYILLSNEASSFRNMLRTIKLLVKENLQTTHDIANLLVTLHKMTVIAEDSRYPATNQGVKWALAYSIHITDHSLW